MSSETDSRGKTICVGSSQTICDEPTETLRNTFKYYLKNELIKPLKSAGHDTSVQPPVLNILLVIMTLNTHLLVLFFRLSMSSLRNRKPSWCAVCVGGWGTAGLLWAGADLERRVVSPGSLGRGRRRGLGRSRARGRSGREDFSGNPLGMRGTSPRAW